jgi:hypothetical protein
MQLPLLSEEQEKMVRRYGSEHCNEMRLLERGSGTVVAGVLIQPFKTKRVAQSAFNQNLKAWQITPPRYLRDWYRELSFEEYNEEFDGVPRVVGRQLQDVVSLAVGAWLEIGNFAVMARDEEVRAKAQLVKAKKERACRLLAGLANRHLKAGFEFLAAPIRQGRREETAKKLAAFQAMRAAELKVLEDEEKAAAEYAERLKCPKFREEVDLARIEEEKKAQAKNVAFHAARKEEKKRQEAEVAPETKKRRIEQIREWP